MAAGLHDKHRERVRKEFLAHGFDDSTPLHKVVEMLLFYSIPRKDTNELAHMLVNKFGTLDRILSASPTELMSIPGIGESTVACFKFIRYVAKDYVDSRNKKISKFASIDELAQFITNKYFDLDKETVAITTFDGSGKLLGFDIVGEGDMATVGVSVRNIMEVVIKRKALSAIISHNHPSGSAIPSTEDVVTTEKIYKVLEDMNVILLDHIVISDDDYVSFVQSSQYRYIFKYLKNK